MHALILAFACGLALAASAQAAPLAPSPGSIELVVAPPVELVAGCGWGWHRVHWQDHWGYWHWLAFRMGMSGTDTAQGSNIPTQIGEALAGVGVIHSEQHARPASRH
jgi:hypothetical protein